MVWSLLLSRFEDEDAKVRWAMATGGIEQALKRKCSDACPVFSCPLPSTPLSSRPAPHKASLGPAVALPVPSVKAAQCALVTFPRP